MELRAHAYRLLVRRQGEHHFEFFRHTRSPVRSLLSVPLKDTCVALVTGAGLFHRVTSDPFVVIPGQGDASFREFSPDVPRKELSFTPGRFNLRAAEIDLEVVLPVQALRRAVERGMAASLCRIVASFHGHMPRPDRFLEETAPSMARHLRAHGAGAAVVVGNCALGAQSAAVCALAFESAGLPTVVITQWPRLARQLGAARTQGSPFPFGITMGPPLVPAAHDWLLARALDRFVSHMK